ncbi:MAG: DNA-binding response regulator [Actinobacteria bacterium]|nr:DNA-binding response regulator [Actinomycetota bacterium]
MSDPRKVLVIEDDPDIAHLVCLRLDRAGYQTMHGTDGSVGLRLLHEHHPDLVLLDIGLPGLDGWQVLERIRDISDVPVVILTARGLETEKVRGLQGGADDYITKPFGHQELVARVGAILRRNSVAGDVARREVVAFGQPVNLTAGEFRLLHVLVQHAGQVLSPEQLLDLAWDDPTGIGASKVKFSILRLRRKLGCSDATRCPIESVRGFGYRYRIREMDERAVPVET